MAPERYFVAPSNIGYQVRDRTTMQCVEVGNGKLLILKKARAAAEAARNLNDLDVKEGGQ